MTAAPKKDFFISYNSANKQIAEWIAWVLEESAYSTTIQAWDFCAGSNFIVAMNEASLQCERTIAVFSQAYMDAKFPQPEWATAFRDDPTGRNGKLIPVRVEDFAIPGMLGPIVYIDLVGLDEEAAKKRLLDEIEVCVKDQRRKPGTKPAFEVITKRTVTPRPVFEKIPAAFRPHRLHGRTDELVGRDDALAWLEQQIFHSTTVTTALSSIHGAGGMGKTFLAQAFAEKFRDRAMFLPVYLGETKPFDAGLHLLSMQNIDVSPIDDEKKLRAMLHAFYSAGTGVLLIDDAKSDDAELLFPKAEGWKVLFTTRDKALARRLCGDRNIKELDVLTPEESIRLMRNVLETKFIGAKLDEYHKLCAYLSNRPYAIRLAAGYLGGAINSDPERLLERLRKDIPAKLDDEYSFERIDALLKECIAQLAAKSPLGMRLVENLAMCADEGIGCTRLLEWQEVMLNESAESLEDTLNCARELGIVLVEEMEGKGSAESGRLATKRLRLHTDTLRVVRKMSAGEEEAVLDSFVGYLKAALVDRKYGKELDRALHLQVFSLIERYGEAEGICGKLYGAFLNHLRRTGELQQAFELGELFRKYSVENEDDNDLQIVYGNQALILQSWGRLDEAMELHKKEETICLELGDKDGLQASYGNQALILQSWVALMRRWSSVRNRKRFASSLGIRLIRRKSTAIRRGYFRIGAASMRRWSSVRNRKRFASSLGIRLICRKSTGIRR